MSSLQATTKHQTLWCFIAHSNILISSSSLCLRSCLAQSLLSASMWMFFCIEEAYNVLPRCKVIFWVWVWILSLSGKGATWWYNTSPMSMMLKFRCQSQVYMASNTLRNAVKIIILRFDFHPPLDPGLFSLHLKQAFLCFESTWRGGLWVFGVWDKLRDRFRFFESKDNFLCNIYKMYIDDMSHKKENTLVPGVLMLRLKQYVFQDRERLLIVGTFFTAF